MPSARSDWLAQRSIGSTIHLRANKEKQNGLPFHFCFAFLAVLLQNISSFGSANYSPCVVYTTTIIHLSVGQIGLVAQ